MLADDADDSPLLALLDAAEERGDVDTRALGRALADALGVPSGEVRAALARPHALARAQVDGVARVLGVDRTLLRRRLATGAPAADALTPPGDSSAGAEGARASAVDDGSEAREPARADASPVLPPTRSTAELIARVVDAVHLAAPWGLAARRALLDAVEDAARAAGRPVPRELHAMRAALGRAASPSPEVRDGERGCAPGETPTPRRPGAPIPAEDVAVLDDAARAVRELQRADPGYAGLFAPLHDDALAALLRRLTLVARDASLGATAAVVVTPPLYGRGLVLRSADATPDQRRLALRIALAHVAAGHVGDETPCPAPAHPHAARVAALAALVDLVPFPQLADLRRQGKLGWRALEAHVAAIVRTLAGDWPDAFAHDLAVLRVALWRRDGL